MAANDSGSSNSSWRGGAGKTPQSGRHAGKKAADWTQKKDRTYEQAVFRYRMKIAAWALLFVCLTIGFLVYINWNPKGTPLVVAVIDDYETPVPPNAWVKEDVERLLSLKSQELVNYSDDLAPFACKSKESITKALRGQLEAAMLSRSKNLDLVIIYLSMHGVVNEKNEACLLPSSSAASPLESGEWLTVKDFLNDLFPNDPKEKDRRPKKVLLLLDCGRIDVNWNMGVLYNSFAERLKEEVERKWKDYPGLVVINSTSPGQIGWGASELKGSVFGYHVWRGLQGEANNGRHKEISLQELRDYLRTQVGQWVRLHRDSDQVPMLLAKDPSDNFPIVYARSSNAYKDSKNAKGGEGRDKRWGEIDGLWLTHETLQKGKVWRYDPLGWAQYQRGLLRLEQLVQAGEAYAPQYTSTKKYIERLARDLEDKLENRSDRQNLAAFSLPLARSLLKWPSERFAEKAVGPWNKVVKVEPTKPTPPKDKAPDTSKNKPAKDSQPAVAPAPEKKPTYDCAAAAVWSSICSEKSVSLQPQSLAKALEFVNNAESRPEADVIEIHFLRMLHSHLDRSVWETASDQVANALKVRNLAEDAAAPKDERAQYWIQKPARQADAIRRQAEDELFVGSKPMLDKAEGLWPKATEQYRQAVDAATALATALEVRDRASAEFPDLARWRLRQSGDAAAMKTELSDVITRSRDLGSALEQGLAREDRLAALPTVQPLVEALRNRLKLEEDAILRECEQLQYNVAGNSPVMQSIASVLEVPLVTGAVRNSLRRKYLEIAEKGKDLKLTSRSGDKQANAGADTKSEAEYLARLRVWQKHPALRVLNSGKIDMERAVAAENAPKPPVKSDSDSKLTDDALLRTLDAQGGEVRQRLLSIGKDAKTLLTAKEPVADNAEPSLSPEIAARTGLSQADCFVRAAAPLAESYAMPRANAWLWDASDKTPTRQLRKFDLCQLLLWHAERALDDFWGPATDKGAPYFQTVAASYLDHADKWIDVRRSYSVKIKDKEKELLSIREQSVTTGIDPKEPKDSFVDDKQAMAPLKLSATTAKGLPPGEAAIYIEDQTKAKMLEPLASSEGQEKPDVRRVGLEVSQKNAAAPWSTECWIPGNNRFQEPFPLQVVTLYRGHRLSRPFTIYPDTGVTIAYQPQPYPNPTVVVCGDTKQKCAIMFVLDCSGSMSDFSMTSDGRIGTRFQMAKDTLKSILKILADAKAYHVGLLLYGHRVGWRPEAPDEQVIWNPVSPDDQTPTTESRGEAQEVLPDLIPKDGDRSRKLPPDLVDVSPWNDTELVCRPSLLDEFQYRTMCEKLRKAHCLGETPLYRAIVESVKELRSRNMNDMSRRRVIVITDGCNDQTQEITPSTNVEEQLKISSSDNKDTDLDIVGFALDKNNEDRLEQKLEEEKGNLKPSERKRFDAALHWLRDPAKKQERRELENRFEELRQLLQSDNVRGTFSRVSNPDGLLKALKKSLQLSRYEVLPVEDDRSERHAPLYLNETWKWIKSPKNGPVPYLVRLADTKLLDNDPDVGQPGNRNEDSARGKQPGEAEVRLEGGEAIELFVKENAKQKRLVHRRYLKDIDIEDSKTFCDRIPAPSDEQKRSFFIGAHLPRWDDAWVFDVSIQNSNAEEFSPRPAETWIEVRPLIAAGDSPSSKPFVYVFYDTYYEPHRPVPVVSCRVPKIPEWPAEAKNAEIQVWCKLTPTPPDKEGAVSALRGSRFRLEGLPDVEFDVDSKVNAVSGQCQVTVTETHPASSDLNTVKVQMDHQPDTIRHTYSVNGSARRTIRHVFAYPQSAATKIDGYRVRLTTRKSIENGATTPGRPLVVEIPGK